MPLVRTHDIQTIAFGGDLAVQKMSAHWLRARLGKSVLRPGGLETRRWLLDRGGIGSDDDVIELAPGLGVTAREILARQPASYAGIERNDGAVALVARRG